MRKKINVGNSEEQRIISLCTGYAGIELGLKRVSPIFRAICYVEVEAFAVANLVAKIEEGSLDAAPIWSDIKTFPAQIFRGKVHGITAGYPCQPFSVAGKRKGADDPRHLWPYIERIIEAVRPVWFFGENVAGHLTIGFPEVYRSLRNLGYSVEAGLFTAAECGAPHKRQRLFILAYNQNTDRRAGEPSKQSKKGQRWDRLANNNTAMADYTKCGCEAGKIQQKRQLSFELFCWPARPGQLQYEWEEPRVVYSKSKRLEGICKTRSGRNEPNEPNKRQAQSRLGGTVDGTKHRVDRLGLLGNGVVPQQAEKAFRYLMKNF